MKRIYFTIIYQKTCTTKVQDNALH